MTSRTRRPHSAAESCLAFAIAGAALCAAPPAAATGALYADVVLRYEPDWSGGCVPTDTDFIDPDAALGAPDYVGGSNATGCVALGEGGLLEVGFTRGRLSNSGDARADLRVYEVGRITEACRVELRPVAPTTAEDLEGMGLRDADADGFFEVGWMPGGTCDFDLDAIFSRAVPEGAVQFDAVRIVDDLADHPPCTATSGADIDAVMALLPATAVTPATWVHVKSLYRE